MQVQLEGYLTEAKLCEVCLYISTQDTLGRRPKAYHP